MSHEAVNWAILQTGLKPAPRIVLIILARHHNHQTGQLNPRQSTLAKECEMSRSSLNVHLKELEARGLVRRIMNRNMVTKRTENNSYELACFAQKPAPRSQTRTLDVVSPCPNSGHGKPEKPCPVSGQTRVQNLDSYKEGKGKREMCATHKHGFTGLFDMLWGQHPRPRHKAETQDELQKALSDGEDPAHIRSGVIAFAHEQSGNKPQYIAGSNTWVKARRWHDFPKPSSSEVGAADREALAQRMLKSKSPAVRETAEKMLGKTGDM